MSFLRKRTLVLRFGYLVFSIVVLGCAAESIEGGEESTAINVNNIADGSIESRVLVVAHRSCWRMAPANSLEAMDKCIELGVDMLEIDVRKSADGHLIVIHDDTVDRTTAHTGRVDEYSLAELTSFQLKDGLGGDQAPLTESLMPSLEQVLIHLKGRVLINLDAKESIRNEVVDLVSELGVNDQIIVKAVVGSPDAPVLAAANYLDQIAFMPIIRSVNGELSEQISSFASMDPVAFETIYENEQQLGEACNSAAEQGARCWVNTMWEDLAPGHSDDVSVLDPDNHWGHLVSLGVNMFQTDRPAELIAYLESKGLR